MPAGQEAHECSTQKPEMTLKHCVVGSKHVLQGRNRPQLKPLTPGPGLGHQGPWGRL